MKNNSKLSIVNSLVILSSNIQPISNDSPIPSFIILALLMESEQEGLLYLSEEDRLQLNEFAGSISDAKNILLAIIADNSIYSVRELIDYFLRQLSFKELDCIINYIYRDLLDEYNFIAFSKGKLINIDNLSRELSSHLIAELTNLKSNQNAVLISGLLYGCRLLKKYLDKDNYHNMIAYLKEGVHFDGLPITEYIINNLDLIRGHIIGLVSN